jgi:hypothetical protein
MSVLAVETMDEVIERTPYERLIEMAEEFEMMARRETDMQGTRAASMSATLFMLVAEDLRKQALSLEV